MMYVGMLIECSGSSMDLIEEKFINQIFFLEKERKKKILFYSRNASELAPTTPGSDLVMILGCEYMLDAIEMLLLRVDSVDMVSGLRRRDSSLSTLLPLISRKSVDISPSERQPSVCFYMDEDNLIKISN